MLLTALGLRKPENNDGFGQDDFNLNANLIDALLQAAGLTAAGVVPACRVSHSLSQSIASATAVKLAFDTERFDTDTIHDNAIFNERLTCRTAGKYLFCGNAEWASNPINGGIRIYVNAVQIAVSTVIGDYRTMTVSGIVDMAVNDYAELYVAQFSGGSINISKTPSYSPEFSMVRVG